MAGCSQQCSCQIDVRYGHVQVACPCHLPMHRGAAPRREVSVPPWRAALPTMLGVYLILRIGCRKMIELREERPRCQPAL